MDEDLGLSVGNRYSLLSIIVSFLLQAAYYILANIEAVLYPIYTIRVRVYAC